MLFFLSIFPHSSHNYLIQPILFQGSIPFCRSRQVLQGFLVFGEGDHPVTVLVDCFRLAIWFGAISISWKVTTDHWPLTTLNIVLQIFTKFSHGWNEALQFRNLSALYKNLPKLRTLFSARPLCKWKWKLFLKRWPKNSFVTLWSFFLLQMANPNDWHRYYHHTSLSRWTSQAVLPCVPQILHGWWNHRHSCEILNTLHFQNLTCPIPLWSPEAPPGCDQICQ